MFQRGTFTFCGKQRRAEPTQRPEAHDSRAEQRQQAERQPHAIADKLLERIPVRMRSFVLNDIRRLSSAKHHVVLFSDLAGKFLIIQQRIRLAGGKDDTSNQRSGDEDSDMTQHGFPRISTLTDVMRNHEQMRDAKHAKQRGGADFRGKRKADGCAAQQGIAELLRFRQPRRAIDRTHDKKGEHHVNGQKMRKLNMENGHA